MKIKKITPNYTLLFGLWLALAMLVGCGPSSASPTLTAVLGCRQGGAGIFTPEDVQCHLDQIDMDQVQRIDEETIVLLDNPELISEWPGAAIIYHNPTLSMLVLDKFGDVDPQASIFSSRAGLAALDRLAANPELMAGLKQQVQLEWLTTPPNEPDIRLSTAWQDGPTTIFLIAVGGLESTDDRFYCPSQTWTNGDDTVEIVADCIAHQAGTPVNHFFFESKTIEGNNERPVQIALNGVPSNVLQVREGPPAQERLIYQAVLQQITSRPLIIRSETAPGMFGNDPSLTEVAPMMVQNYLAVNEVAFSLLYLFQGSNVYFVHPSASIDRDFLTGDPRTTCVQFRSHYPDLGGVATLSRIGMGDDGTQALVHALLECGLDDRWAAYFTLEKTDDGWQVTNTIKAVSELPVLAPKMVYESRSGGCGDIFVYKSNRAGSEFIYVGIDVTTFDVSEEPVTLELAAYPETIGSRIEVYSSSPEQNPYCNDVGQTEYPQSVWQAVSGSVTITSSETSAAIAQREPCSETYQVSVEMEDVVFALEEETVRLPSLMFSDVQVGWCAG